VSERYDAVLIGLGPGGEVAAGRLLAASKRVAVVERELIGVVADRERQVLVGAWAVAPLAGEWIHLAALAIRAAIPLDVLADQVAQFPPYTEANLKALESLER